MTDTTPTTTALPPEATTPPAAPAETAKPPTASKREKALQKAAELREVAGNLEAAKGGDTAARAQIAKEGGVSITEKKGEFTAKGLGVQSSSFVSGDVALDIWSRAARRTATQLEH